MVILLRFLFLHLKKLFIISIFTPICFTLFAQREKAETYYKDGHLESKGLLYTYSVYNNIKSLPKKFQFFGEIQKKGKEWKYWYQNGILKRIENYKLVKDKNPSDLPDGKWIYYNEQGVKYREDTYLDGVITGTIKEIYKDKKLFGKISLQNGISDTTLISPLIIGNNLIINPEFDYFYYKPIPVIYDGRSKIEEWIPYWLAPGNYTPDYLSNLRSINVLSLYSLFGFPIPDKFDYAGIALFKESEPYSEYIQGRLIKPLIRGHNYCIRVSIVLSSYSGFSVNRLAFHLSSGPLTLSESNEGAIKPQVILSVSAVDDKRFTTICDFFIAEGGERYITIGRLCPPDSLEIIQRENTPQTEFGIGKSAYYLLDNVDLYEIDDSFECNCENDAIQTDSTALLSIGDKFFNETDLNKSGTGIPVILKNVNFGFNSYILDFNADSSLKALLNYLNDHPDIKLKISGYTDDIGTEEYNYELSVNRAKSVYKWLIGNGVDSTRLQYTGFGKSFPIFKENDERSRALNRRVEVRIIDSP